MTKMVNLRDLICLFLKNRMTMTITKMRNVKILIITNNRTYEENSILFFDI